MKAVVGIRYSNSYNSFHLTSSPQRQCLKISVFSVYIYDSRIKYIIKGWCEDLHKFPSFEIRMFICNMVGILGNHEEVEFGRMCSRS